MQEKILDIGIDYFIKKEYFLIKTSIKELRKIFDEKYKDLIKHNKFYTFNNYCLNKVGFDYKEKMKNEEFKYNIESAYRIERNLFFKNNKLRKKHYDISIEKSFISIHCFKTKIMNDNIFLSDGIILEGVNRIFSEQTDDSKEVYVKVYTNLNNLDERNIIFRNYINKNSKSTSFFDRGLKTYLNLRLNIVINEENEYQINKLFKNYFSKHLYGKKFFFEDLKFIYHIYNKIIEENLTIEILYLLSKEMKECRIRSPRDFSYEDLDIYLFDKKIDELKKISSLYSQKEKKELIFDILSLFFKYV